ncbi:hypothetical protein [Streptomyces carpinensis]|uniref:Uncharacterized protein n=1 Tax=Streptomyces carpinensis TaxID=66369 RepID=A0ABV1W9X3_9ACTN|nr:hypothetical protein [Streptomyces carpinensis]
MTAHTTDKPQAHRPQTGWAEARRQRENGVRTCLPAVDDRGGSRSDRHGADWNIVRGED